MASFANKVLRSLAIVSVAVALMVVFPTSVTAKGKGGVNDAIMEEDASKSYALPYALVVLGVALGVMIIARPGTRSDEPKKRTDEDEED